MKRIILILSLYLFFPCMLFANESTPPASLGTLTLSDKILTVHQVGLPVYQVTQQDYVPLYYLSSLGYTIAQDASTNTFTLSRPTKSLLNTHFDEEVYWTTHFLENAT